MPSQALDPSECQLVLGGATRGALCSGGCARGGATTASWGWGAGRPLPSLGCSYDRCLTRVLDASCGWAHTALSSPCRPHPASPTRLARAAQEPARAERGPKLIVWADLEGLFGRSWALGCSAGRAPHAVLQVHVGDGDARRAPALRPYAFGHAFFALQGKLPPPNDARRRCRRA